MFFARNVFISFADPFEFFLKKNLYYSFAVNIFAF
jgi:hypothetical protein